MTNAFRIFVMALAVGSSVGCVTTTHMITTQAWMDDGSGAYMGYLEGPQGRMNKSHVQWCKLRDDNSLDCTQQGALEALLNP